MNEAIEARTHVHWHYAQARQIACLPWLPKLISAAKDIVSLVLSDGGSINGGNWQNFEQIVKRPGAQRKFSSRPK
jgi:hypothetical protein